MIFYVAIVIFLYGRR